ncbi:MAG: sigma-54 factor interaction domain-containing protein [Acidobacteria bacterium]|nr:sigma-54 factor interaction domain-containing protein [Acidobacteriota bacterium]
MDYDPEAKIRIISISITPNAVPAFDSLPIASAEELLLVRDRTAPVAHVIGISESEALFAKLRNAIHDCGKQRRSGVHNQTIALSKYMLDKRPKIPLIRADYSVSGRALQGISHLLKEAGEDCNIYLIAVNDKVLEGLNREAGAKRANPPSHAYFLQNIPDDPELASVYIGREPAFIKVRKQIQVAAGNDLPVLIIGESGTGKELVAREIHNRSRRAQKGGKFLAVNCAAISPYLLESELFGVEAHYLPEIKVTKKGLWEEAGGGTLLLDEIGNMSIEHQPKILRALQNKEIYRLGGTKVIRVDARVLAATNKDLVGMIARREFMADLYSRLACIPIYTPSLRESPAALEYLAQQCWKKITGRPDGALPREIIHILPEYTLLGNYRALQNALNRLHAYMSAEGLTRVNKAYFREAMENPEHLLGSLDVPTTAGGAEAYRAECLQNLREAAKYIRKCKVVLRPLLRGIVQDEKSISRILSALREPYEELDGLCMDPSAFYGYETHTEVSQFVGRFAGLMDQLKIDPARVLAYWEKHLENWYDLTLGRIQHEIMELTQV